MDKERDVKKLKYEIAQEFGLSARMNGREDPRGKETGRKAGTKDKAKTKVGKYSK